MADKDVRLVIRARNEASKAIESVADALKQLSDSQKKTGQSAKQMESLLSTLGAEFQKLNKEAAALGALSKISTELDKATAAVKRLEEAARASSDDLAKLTRDSEQAAATTARLKAQAERLASAYEQQKNAVREARKEQTAANEALRRAEALQRRVATAARRHVSQSPWSNAAESAQVFVGAEVAQARQNAEMAAGSYKRLREEQEALARSRQDLNQQIRAAVSAEAQLRSETEKAAGAVRKQEAALTSAREELGQIQAVAKSAAGAIGQVGISQTELAKRSQQVAAELQRSQAVLAAMQRFSTGVPGQFADPETAARLRAQREEVERARQAYNLLNAEAQRLAQNMRASVSTTAEQARAVREAAAAARAAAAEYHRQVQILNQMPGAVSRMTGLRGIFAEFYGDSRKAMSLMQRLRGEVLSLATAYFGLYNAIRQVGEVIRAFQKLEAAQNRLGAVFKQNMEAVRSEMEWLQRQSARLGIEFGVLSDEYSKFAVAAQAANFESANVRKIFLAVAEAARVNKLSMDQMSGVFLALQQMISKGKVTSEELRRQLGDRLPGAFNIMAEALGLTTAQLDEMMKKGEILADETNLLKFAEELNRRFGPQLADALRSTTTLLGQFTNELFQAQLRIAEGGFIDSLNKALERMISYFRSREGRDFFLGLGAALGRFMDLVSFAVENINYFTFALKALIAVKVGQWLAGIVGRVVAFQGGMKAAAAGAVTLTTQLGVLRGAVVAFTTSITAATTAMMRFLPTLVLTAGAYLLTDYLANWLTAVDDVTQKVDEHNRVMQEVIRAYEDAKRAGTDWRNSIDKSLAQAAESNFIAQLELYEDALDKLESKMSSFLRIRILEDSEVRRVRDFFEEFGKVSSENIDEFIRKLDELDRGITNIEAKKLVNEVRDLANKFKDASTRTSEAAVAAKELGSQLKELDEHARRTTDGLEGLSSGIGAVTESATKGADALENYNNALNSLKEKIPELSQEMRKLKELSEIEANFQEALKAAVQLPEAHEYVREAYRIRDRAIREVELKFSNLNPLINSIDTNSAELRRFYEEIRGSANLMSRNMEKWGDPSSAAWRQANLTTIQTASGLKATVHKAAAPFFQGFINELESLGYEIRQLGGFNYRLKRGGRTLSEHAFGNAIDINWDLNPMMKELRTNLPKEIGRIAAKYGLSWGGDWRNIKDPMHFEWTGRMPPGAQHMSQAELEVQRQITSEIQKQNEEKRRAQEATQRTIEDNEFALQQEERRIAGLEKEAAIEEALRRARKENPYITPEELERIRQQTELLYERQRTLSQEEQIKERIRQINEQIRLLEQERNALLQQRKYYEDRGDVESMRRVEAQLQAVNEKLRQAIQNAIEFWQSIGGPQADAAIAKLQATALNIQNVGNQFSISARQIDESVANRLVGAFDRFAQAVARGENAIKALAEAFLQFAAEFLIEIGKMILKQAIFNALQQMGFGRSIVGFMGGLFHQGGVVGSSRVPARAVNPAWFQNALRYHRGGIAGLKPDEVPAILKAGEEVITEADPRHRLNGGLGPGPINMRIVNTFDAADVVSQGLSSHVGEQTFINVVRSNRSTIREILGVA